jgi:nitrous oxidase accessory protein
MGRKNEIFLRVLATLLLTSCFALAVPAVKADATPRTITVPDDFESIQDAVRNATAGDTVYVRAGNYTIPPNWNDYELEIPNSVSLIGENPQNTIIETTQIHRSIFGFNYGIGIGDDSLISGFTITGDYHVIFLLGNGRITNNIINLTANGSTAISAVSGIISSNIINGGREGMANQNPVGGLVGGNTGIETNRANVTISNNIINGFGSGIWVGGGNLMITNNTFTNNYLALTVSGNPAGNPSLLQGNNIVNSTAYALYAMANVNATYNWWGMTDAQKITTLITTGLHTANVTYIPFLTAPNPQATPIKSTADPPPSSGTEPFPIVPVAVASIASVGILAVGLLVCWKKRKR